MGKSPHCKLSSSGASPRDLRYAVKKNHGVHIKAVYAFSEESARCGESNCLQTHHQGFLISSASGKETNLCASCGQIHLGVSLEQQKKRLQGQSTVRQKQIQLNTVLEQSDTIKNRVKELKRMPYGANWLYQTLAFFRQAYPKELLSALTTLADNQEDNTILNTLIENEASPSCLENVEQLQGLQIFKTDIKEALVGNILMPLKELEAIAESQGSSTDLDNLCQWAECLEKHFSLAEALIKEGQLFFTRENIKRLSSIPLSEKNTRALRSLRWDSGQTLAK